MQRYKRESIVLALILACLLINTVKSAIPGGRYGAASWFYDNKLWMFGGKGWDETSTSAGLLSDMWSYDPNTGAWTFVAGNKAINMMGLAGSLGSYSPNNNPGGILEQCSWFDEPTKQFWIFGGQVAITPSVAYTNQVWTFDPNTTQWAQMFSGTSVGSFGPTVFQPGPRALHKCVSMGQSDAYISGGYGHDTTLNLGYLNDLWYFNASGWTFISGNDTRDCASTLSAFDAPSASEYPACGTRIAGWATSPADLYFVTGLAYSGYLNDVYQYTDGQPSTWTLLHPGDLTKRVDSASTSSNGKTWLFGGTGKTFNDTVGSLADLLEWNGTAWNYLAGSQTANTAGSYPAQPGTGNSSTYPGSRSQATIWLDGAGDLWLFGGFGYGSLSTTAGSLNDLWKYTMNTGVWTWIGGSNNINQNGNYTAIPISTPANNPPVNTPIEPPVTAPVNPPQDLPPTSSPVTPPTDVPSSNEVNVPTSVLPRDAQIAIGVVVPGVAVGAGLLVLLLLLKKRKKQKANKSSTTTLVPLGDFKPDPRYGAVDTTANAYSHMEGLAVGSYVDLPANENNRLIPYASVTLEKEIGEGSFGKVFLGKLRTTKVAIKVANTKLPQDEFIREANFQLAIPPHPNIVQLLGISIDGPQPLVILEYCNEGSLDKILFKTEKLRSPAEQIALAEAIARGIDHLHQNNIVHRDLAVRNILLHHGEPKISDFGMSRKLKEVSQVGKTATTIGPLRWMAPEALGKQLYSTKSDVWSFGMILFEIVAHEEPHEHEDLISVAIGIRDEGFAPAIPDNCPQVLRQVMQMCWKMDPNERPDMGTICNMLESSTKTE